MYITHTHKHTHARIHTHTRTHTHTHTHARARVHARIYKCIPWRSLGRRKNSVQGWKEKALSPRPRGSVYACRDRRLYVFACILACMCVRADYVICVGVCVGVCLCVLVYRSHVWMSSCDFFVGLCVWMYTNMHARGHVSNIPFTSSTTMLPLIRHACVAEDCRSSD